MAGSGGVIVIDDSRKMSWVLNNLNAFYAHESCGQCTPCREGSTWMKKISDRIVAGDASPRMWPTSKAWPIRSTAARSAPSARPDSWPVEAIIATQVPRRTASPQKSRRHQLKRHAVVFPSSTTEYCLANIPPMFVTVFHRIPAPALGTSGEVEATA
jgi:hypothetical protein